MDSTDGSDSDAMESSLSEAQDKALSLLPLFSGLLSAWGSANIIYMFYQTSKDRRSVYKRIMLGLSASDFLSSITLSLQPFLLPADTSQRIWASGTAATCSAMGFFQQLAFSAIWYNGMLSFFFLLSIKYAISETDLARKYEPWMHLLSIGVPLISAAIGAGMQMYDELVVGHFCWFTGDDTTIFAFLVAGGPGFFFLLAIPWNNLQVYRHIRSTTQKDFMQQDAVVVNGTGSGKVAELPKMHHQSAATITTGSSVQSTFSNEQLQLEEQRDQQRDKQAERLSQDRHKERLQAVAFQSCLYVASFMVTHIPTMILRVTSAVVKLSPSNEVQYFPLLVIQAILLPLQGLFNYIIYSRSCHLLREAVG